MQGASCWIVSWFPWVVTQPIYISTPKTSSGPSLICLVGGTESQPFLTPSLPPIRSSFPAANANVAVGTAQRSPSLFSAVHQHGGGLSGHHFSGGQGYGLHCHGIEGLQCKSLSHNVGHA